MTTLKTGSTGTDVSVLQQALVEAGYAVSGTEMWSGVYGATTTAAVSAYQTSHGLTPDGVCGPKTWASLSADGTPTDAPPGWRMADARPEIIPVMLQAQSCVGVVEQPPGSNRGDKIDAWNKTAGIPLGSPWCAAFATGMWFASPSNPFRYALGSALKVREWGDAKQRSLRPSAIAQVGDLFVIMRSTTSGHVGLVAADLGDKVATIEGNAGNAVKRLVRPKDSLTTLVRPLG